MKRPLVNVACVYVGGILLGALPIPLAELFALALVLALVFIFWSTARRVALFALIVLAGWINVAQRTVVLSPDDLRTLFPGDALVTVRGVLLETPVHRVREIKNQTFWSSHVRISVSEISGSGQPWQPAHGEIIGGLSQYLPDNFFAGQTVRVSGVLHPPRGPAAPGLFDYRSFLANQGIYHQLDTKKIADWEIISGSARPPLGDRFCAWARKSLGQGLPVEDETLQLEWALTLGWKAALTDEISEPFMKAATFHIFAVDGLRIAIVSGILLALFRALNVPRALCGVLITPFILFYAAMTGWPASAIRAIIMILVIFGGWLLKRPSDLINSLFAAALIILVWEPRQLFQSGFQLSFFVVLCIVLIQPFFNRVGEHLLQPDPFLPESLQPRWQKILRVPARWGVDLFLASLAAWLGSIPLAAWYFHLLTPVSGLSNVLAVPLCALVLICNLTSLLLIKWLPFAAELYNHAGWFFMSCIRSSSAWSAHWPGAYWYVPMPGFFSIALYYLVLTTVLTGWLFRDQHRRWKIIFISALVLVWCGFWIWERPVQRLTVLPLEGGHALYLNSAWRQPDWLIDCGNQSGVESVTEPFLKAQGVNRLDNFALTHGEVYYSGGAPFITDIFPSRNIFVSSTHYRSPEFRDFVKDNDHNPSWRAGLKAGDQVGPCTILFPPATLTTAAKATDAPLVIRVNLEGLRVLSLSDLSHNGQNALLATGVDLHASVLIAGIADENEAIDEAMIRAVAPQVIIVADARKPAAKRADENLKRRLLSHHVPVFYLSESDAVTIIARPHHWEITAMDGIAIIGDPAAMSQ